MKVGTRVKVFGQSFQYFILKVFVFKIKYWYLNTIFLVHFIFLCNSIISNKKKNRETGVWFEIGNKIHKKWLIAIIIQ